MNATDWSVIESRGCFVLSTGTLTNFKYLLRGEKPRLRADIPFQQHPFTSSIIHLGCEPLDV